VSSFALREESKEKTMIARSQFLLLGCLLIISGLSCAALAQDADTKVHVGEMAPDFTVTTTDKNQISLKDLKGKVVLLTFFATWCPPCRAELPHVEADVWQRLKNKGLSVLVIGREQKLDDVGPFKSEMKLTMPVGADPDRSIYAKYANKSIPRSYVIDKTGKIIFASVGFEEAEFANMSKLIEQELVQSVR
jgi:peroxiredoxin